MPTPAIVNAGVAEFVVHNTGDAPVVFQVAENDREVEAEATVAAGDTGRVTVTIHADDTYVLWCGDTAGPTVHQAE